MTSSTNSSTTTSTWLPADCWYRIFDALIDLTPKTSQLSVNARDPYEHLRSLVSTSHQLQQQITQWDIDRYPVNAQRYRIKTLFATGNSLFILNDMGQLMAHGENNHGHLGTGHTNVKSPLALVSLPPITHFCSNGLISIAIDEQQQLYQWGYEVQQQGQRMVGIDNPNPQLKIKLPEPVKQLFALQDSFLVYTPHHLWYVKDKAFSATNEWVDLFDQLPFVLTPEDIEDVACANHVMLKTRFETLWGFGPQCVRRAWNRA